MAFDWSTWWGGATTLLAVPVTWWCTNKTASRTEKRAAHDALLLNAYELVRAANAYRAKVVSEAVLFNGPLARGGDYAQTLATYLRFKEQHPRPSRWQKLALVHGAEAAGSLVADLAHMRAVRAEADALRVQVDNAALPLLTYANQAVVDAAQRLLATTEVQQRWGGKAKRANTRRFDQAKAALLHTVRATRP